MRRRRLGIGWRQPLADWLASAPEGVDCLEVTAEHFYDGGAATLRDLAARYPLSVHGLGLSLGTPGPLDGADLDRFAAVVEAGDARWVSEHVAFTRAGGIDLGHLNPVPLTRESLRVLGRHVLEVQRLCGRRLLLENIATDLPPPGDLDEPAFLNALCRETGAGLLLDVTNLHVNARNHGYPAHAWLDRLDTSLVVQAHVVGYTERDGYLRDEHAAEVQPELYDLLDRVAGFASLEAVIIERDRDFPPPAALATEVCAIGHVLGRA